MYLSGGGLFACQKDYIHVLVRLWASCLSNGLYICTCQVVGYLLVKWTIYMYLLGGGVFACHMADCVTVAW